jgi:processive 1,2-diacylglycerol beta-glucosyltransferase
MRRRKLVVLSVSAGAGHLRAAEAVCEQARASGLDCAHLDVLQHVPAWFRWLYADLYALLVNRAPLLWSWLYGRMNQAGPPGTLQRLRRYLERRLGKRWLAALARLEPDAILCTHFLPAEVLQHAGAASPAACPVFIHITDFDLHAMWLQPGAHGYFAGCEEVAFQLRRAGVDAARVVVSGLAVMASFRPFPAPPPLLRQYFPVDRPAPHSTVLLMGGGGGFGGLAEVAEQLLDGAGAFRLLVLTGRNASALAALQALAPRWPGRLVALGYTDQVAALMAGADIVITKPGGLSSAECLAVGAAIIVNAPIPGQEERNADYLLEQGVALKAVNAATLAWRLQYLLDHPDQRRAMAQRARQLGRPGAARCIVDTISLHLKAMP